MGFNEVIDLSESGVAYSHQQIVAIKDYLDRNPDTVLRTLRALIEGLAAWNDPAKKSQALSNGQKVYRDDQDYRILVWFDDEVWYDLSAWATTIAPSSRDPRE